MFADSGSIGVAGHRWRRVDPADGLAEVRAFLARRVGAGDVDDMVQDVALRLQVSKREGDIHNRRAYLFQVARSVMLDRRRRDACRSHSQHVPLTELHHPCDDISPLRVLEGKQQLSLVLAALQALPPRTAQVFSLHRFEWMSYAQIGAELGISVSAVEKHIMKAIRHLAEHCGG